MGAPETGETKRGDRKRSRLGTNTKTARLMPCGPWRSRYSTHRRDNAGRCGETDDQLLLWPGTRPPAGAVVSLPLPMSPLRAVDEPAELEFIAPSLLMVPPDIEEPESVEGAIVEDIPSVDVAAPLHCAAVGLAAQSVCEPEVVGASSAERELSELLEPDWAKAGATKRLTAAAATRSFMTSPFEWLEDDAETAQSHEQLLRQNAYIFSQLRVAPSFDETNLKLGGRCHTNSPGR